MNEETITDEMRKDIMRRCDSFSRKFMCVSAWPTAIEMDMSICMRDGHILALHITQDHDKIRISDYGDTAAHHELTLAQVKRLCRRHHLKIERCEDFDGPDYPYLAIYTVVEPREFDRGVWSIIRAVRDSFEMVVEKRYEKLLNNKRKRV